MNIDKELESAPVKKSYILSIKGRKYQLNNLHDGRYFIKMLIDESIIKEGTRMFTIDTKDVNEFCIYSQDMKWSLKRQVFSGNL